MCVASDDWQGTGIATGGFSGTYDMVPVEVPHVIITPTAFAAIDWSEVHPPLAALDPSLLATPVPGGPIEVEVDEKELDALRDLLNVYAGRSYLPSW